MNDETRKELFRMVKTVYAGYGKGIPDPETFDAFVLFLEPFPLATIRAALAEHCNRSGFAPTAAVIAGRCREMDGRPTADEAWAIALRGVDEAETVVWTTETMRAFYVCKPVLDTGDKIGARMAFRDVYNRLVADARTQREPVKWEVSLGTDVQRREVALSTARAAGLVAWTAAPALEGPDGVSGEKRQEVSRKVRELLASLRSGQKKRDRQRVREIERQRLETVRRKSEIAGAVAAYGEKVA